MIILKKISKRLGPSRGGQMPFAIIAVILLIMGSAYGAVSVLTKESAQNAEDIVSELGTIDSMIADTKTMVEKGLGEIIFDISTDSDGGPLTERKDRFDERSKTWLGTVFPRQNKGVSVTMIDHDIALSIESLKLSGTDSLTEGFTPSYLKATGYYTAKFVSDTGISTKTTEISTDGSCALPLVAEQGSLFDNMVTGPGSVLSQMMSYQLTSLAQFRVLNGYGALAEYGDMGTMSILTQEDVDEAYRNSLNVLELMCFRNTDDAEFNKMEKIDLADILVASDGHIELDISAIYSQALISITDDLVLKWFDYFYGNRLLNLSDRVSDIFSNAFDSLKGFFSGKNEFSAAPYIEALLTENGYNASFHRYLLTGKTFNITVPATAVKATVGNSTGIINIPELRINVPYPSVDLMNWPGISKFKSNYREETNEIRDWLRSVINTAAVDIGQSKTFGTVIVNIDPSDERSLMDSVSEAIRVALDKGNTEVDRIMTSAISTQTISDPFYAEIYRVIAKDHDSIYMVSQFENNIRSNIRDAIDKELKTQIGTILDPTVVDTVVDSIINGSEVRNALNNYRSATDKCISELEVLMKVPGGQPGFIKRVAIEIFKCGVLFTDTFTNVSERINTLCEEVLRNEEVGAYDGLIVLPTEKDFTLVSTNGETIEKLEIKSDRAPSVWIFGPNDNLSDCMHYVGFNENTGASYSTAFSISLKDELSYQADSTGKLEAAMGTSDSIYKGSASIDMELKIVVASGWGLAGVKDYRASNTILGDAWNALVKLLSPLLEPLRKVLSMISDALSVLSSALMEVAKYVASIVERLYNAIMGPLEQLKNFIEEKLSAIFTPIVEKAVEAIQWIVGIDLSKQTVGFSFMGFTVTFTTQMSTWINNTKTLLTVKMTGVINKLTLSGSITIKQKGSGSDKELILSGAAEIIADNWNIHATIDPMMKSSIHMISMYGTVKGVKFDVLLPDLVQYQHIDFALSDIPAIGIMLSNIPIPIPGMKASIDAGIDLKYNIPFETGILINEFELNPPGEDKDNEWVELYNATLSTVDLSGYTIHAGSNPQTKVHRITNMILTPGQREVVYLPGSFLNNSGSSILSGGETVILRSPTGEDVTSTPAKKDSKNDGQTWQRVADGAIDWVLADGTPGGGNCGGLISGEMIKTQILKVLKDSAVKTMGKMKKLTSTEDLSEFFKIAIHDAITTGIELIAGCLVEASIFISIEIGDATSTLCAGFRVALSIDSGFVEEGLKYLVGEIESLLMNIENPYGLKLKEVFTDNVYFGVTVYTGISSPKFLNNIDMYPETKLGVHIDTNISGLVRLIGKNTGTWKVNAGVLIMDCPSALLPSVMKANKTLDSDLWLIRAVFTSA